MKRHAHNIRQPYSLLPFILFFFAACFLVTLLLTIKEGVFFSGDAGLKFLMVKQIAGGGSYTTLNLEAPLWVSKIWSRGFYPFKAPFVYDSPQGKVISFPPAFQWLTSCLYKYAGFKGIYIVPFLSLTAMWLWFIFFMKKTGVKPLVISVAFILLAFCSPLTIYGALYWEHSLSILLSFSAIVFLLLKRVSDFYAVLSGLMTGMSVWLRPEMLLLCLLLVMIILFNNLKEKNKANIIFIASLLTGVLAYLIFNSLVYGIILGQHSVQLSAPEGFKKYLMDKMIILFHLNGRLLLYFPLTGLFYGIIFYLSGKRITLPLIVRQLTVIITLFLLIAPLALPNAGGKQWGPRYFLNVIPVIIMLSVVVMEHGLIKFNKWLLLILIPVAAYSMYLNVYLARRTLKRDYAYRVKPGLDFLKKQSCDVLVVQNQFIAQEYAALFDTKKIFLAEDQQSFNMLMKLLQDEGITKIIFMSHDADFKRLPENLISGNSILKKIGDYYFAEYNIK